MTATDVLSLDERVAAGCARIRERVTIDLTDAYSRDWHGAGLSEGMAWARDRASERALTEVWRAADAGWTLARAFEMFPELGAELRAVDNWDVVPEGYRVGFVTAAAEAWIWRREISAEAA